jgi:DNA helicase-2/ATP-dependent DNA helicase PcrA
MLDQRTLLEDLTEAQQKAVRHTEGPLLVLAAAGSGKTRVITRRIAYLVSCGVPGWSILALTFTNKAAGEMRERVHRLLRGHDERALRGLTVTTFHALCARLLRRFAAADPALVGIGPDFTIYDADDQSRLCKRVIEGLQLSTSNFPPRSVLSAISAAKNELVDVEAYTARAGEFYTRTIAKVYASYQRGLRAANAVDFDDLLMLTARALRASETLRDQCRSRWQYLLVDEYQDTNHAQFVLASLLAGDGGGHGPNICVVGDPDQSIYGWRGADISNILDFEAHYPRCAVITLGENFRSTAPILAAADSLIRHNRLRKHKDLFTRRPGGEKVDLVYCHDEHDEARVVAEWLDERRSCDGVAWRDLAVFYRSNALSRVMEEALRAAGIPYVIARGTAFYEREEIRNALAYLRLLANPADEVSLERIINTPARGIGDASLARVQTFAQRHNISTFDALARVGQVEGVTSRAAAAIGRFVAMVRAWTGSGSFLGAEVPASLAELVERVIKESGLEAMYAGQARAGHSEADEERPENLAELVSSARQFEDEYDASADPAAAEGTPPLLSLLRAFLESVSLVADADAIDPAQGSVTLMTLHAAKGLEFHAAAVIGLEEGLLPHARSQDSEAMLEEERRLCFVGITRAMRRLLLTTASRRTLRGIPERTVPSRFLDEIAPEAVRVTRREPDRDSWAEVRPDADSGGQASRLFPVGSRVRHPQFGVGIVESISGNLATGRAVIAFKSVGRKTLVLEYARLTPVP